VTLLIDVGTVLRGTVCSLYSNLVTRPTGAAVRTAIERQVHEAGTPVLTAIDFSQVHLLDFSCADEIVAKLLLRYAAPDGPPGWVLFRGIADAHLDPIETVLAHHGLALVRWDGGVPQLVGTVTDAERTHWDAVRALGAAPAEAVADALRADVPPTVERLEALARRRLLMRRDTAWAVPGLPPEWS
jgi:hypothetical protein